MKAVIEVKKGESPYRIVRSSWLKDKRRPVLFKLLSKKQQGGKIEAVYVVERKGGRKTVLGRSVVEEERFMDVVEAFRSGVWRFFPNTDLEVEDIKHIDFFRPRSTSQYSISKNTKIGIFWLRIKNWLEI